MLSVWRTQLSGDRESRHIRRSTRRPYRPPAKYQAKSAIRLAIVATAITCGTLIPPRAVMAPTTMSVG